MKGQFSIAIDGTAASGKSTVAKLLAEELSCSYLDTGKLYRALALDFLARSEKAPDDWAESPAEISKLLQSVKLELVTPEAGECRLILHGHDVNEQLADLKVEKATPFAARLADVRAYLLDVQRNLAQTSSVVMAGRDIGTVVLPNATLKVFIKADLEERAKRRLSQHKDNFSKQELEQAAADLHQRDEKDANRELAPMKAAADSLLLDSTNQTPDELVESIVQALRLRTVSQAE